MHRLIWLIPLLPLAGAAINGLLGRRFRFSETLIGSIAVGSVALAFLLGLAAVYSYGYSDHPIWPKAYVTSDDGAFGYTWIPGGAVELTHGLKERAHIESMAGVEEIARRQAAEQGLPPGSPVLVGAPYVEERRGVGALLNVEWSYQLDALSSVFILIITGVGLCIFIFATGYMHGDPGFYRFFAYLGLFMFSMLVLVMGSNFMMMFVGWEGVGLCSYLLIGYYFDRKEAGDASRKAFITNRIGDFGFALAIAAIIATFGTTEYRSVMEQARAYPIELIGEWGILTWIALGLFVGAVGKSAQIPLFVWLPDAMAGPTPVSALIHAATMVTAGLYMLTRTNVLFQHSQTMMLVVAVVGAATALFAATIGITQNDIKKVLAYSTVSQLGFMFLACGVGAFVIGIFHVMTHAFFKGLMFLGAGSVIHGMHHEQDMRRMGNLRKYMPITYMTFLAGWLAICGIIPFSGFWSKDEILWNAASTTYIPYGWLLWLVGTLAATCTAFYMTRLVAMTFWGKERFLEVTAGGQADEAHAHGYDEQTKPHDARNESAGDRPHHEPGEHVGIAHTLDSAHADDATHSTAHTVAHAIHDAHGHDEAHGHQHGAHVPHESPPSMWIPLAVLATLSVVGGLVGIGPAFHAITGSEHPGGRVHIVNWLDPIIWNPATGQFGKEHAAGGAQEHAEAKGRQEKGESETAAGSARHANVDSQSSGSELLLASNDATLLAQAGTERSEAGAGHDAASGKSETGAGHATETGATYSPYGDTGFNLAHAAEHSLGSHGAAEWLFIGISLAVAALGILLGLLFYVWRPQMANAWASRLRPLYRASFNKYWIDELYGALFTRRTMDAARGVFSFDSKVLDGAVNGTAWLTRTLSRVTGNADRYIVDGLVNTIAGFIKNLMSPMIRATQTGLTANYALVMVFGLVIAFALFFGRDLLTAVRGVFAMIQ
ncbi:MAG TPA: NADH-quinone oxidoreductase subunit L [Pyrinomonadaceae bacterium]|jgi:NADH-quinone oxidoreductase subunit L